MKKRIINSIVFICLFSVISIIGVKNSQSSDTPRSQAASVGPVARVTEKVFEFGEALEGEVILHDYMIENVGDASLTILDVRSSCGCTIASVHPSK